MPIRLVAIALTLFTGISGLVYEVTWQKYLATLLGSHSEATAAVLAIFLGGLSLGYALFGALTRRLARQSLEQGTRARLLLVYGVVEIGIGIYALLFPALFQVAQQASLFVPASGPGLAFGFDVLLAALLIGPPTVLMGGTIPILTLALAGNLAQVTRIHAWVYGFNTLGAFVGALAGAFWLIPALGLDGTLFAMAAINLLAGGVFVLLDSRSAAVSPDFREEPGVGVAALRGYAAVALLAGFAMMTLQTTFNRVGALALGSSGFTFAMVVAVFVLCIALGSLLVSALPRIPRWLLPISQWLLVLLLGLLYLQIEDVPYYAHRLRAIFATHESAFLPYQLAFFQALFVVLALPIGLSGTLLPLVFDHLRREAEGLGSAAGRLYAWNTVGSLLGALLGGYVLFLWFDLHEIYRIALAALSLAALILSTSTLSGRTRYVSFAVLPVVLITLVSLPAWNPQQISSGTFRFRDAGEFVRGGLPAFREWAGRRELVSYDDDPTSTVSVVRTADDSGQTHSIIVNGKSDGDLRGDFVTMALTGLVPALLADSHESAFVVGLGTGVTVGELAALENTRRIDVAEISRGVIDAAPIFDYGNHGVSKNPKVQIRRGDAYRSLLEGDERYDLIISEPSNPWVAGVEMLFAREFLEAARERLAPGGVYAQWFHLYEVDNQTVQLVLRTYAEVFPHVSVWFTQSTDLLLLGFDAPERALDTRALRRRFLLSDFRAGFARAEIDNFPSLLAHELLPLGVLHANPSEGPVHTLRHPILSDLAARAFFQGGRAGSLHAVDLASARVGADHSLLRRQAGLRPGELLPEPLLRAAVDQACGHKRLRECTTLLASWLYAHPRSKLRQSVTASVARTSDLPLEMATVRELARLFGGPPVHSGPLAAERLFEMTGQFVSYYHHATPFDPAVIEARWRRCDGAACEDLEERARDWIGIDPGKGSGAEAHGAQLPPPAVAPARP